MEGYSLNLEVEHLPRITKIDFRIRTSIDCTNYKYFISNVISACNGDPNIIINFERVNRIDSAGISALIYLHKKIVNGTGRLALVNPNKIVLSFIHSFGLLKLFELYSSIPKAVSRLKAKQEKQVFQTSMLVLQLKRTSSYLLVKIKSPNWLNKKNCIRFQKKIEEYSEQHSTIIINLDNIHNIDNEGIAMLIDLKFYAKENSKDFILVYNNRVLRRLFKMYSVDEILPHFEYNSEAIFSIGDKTKPIPTNEYTNALAYSTS